MAEKNRGLSDKIEELKQEIKFYKNNYNQEIQKTKESLDKYNNVSMALQNIEKNLQLEFQIKYDELKS